jgi:hypothetical protein
MVLTDTKRSGGEIATSMNLETYEKDTCMAKLSYSLLVNKITRYNQKYVTRFPTG